MDSALKVKLVSIMILSLFLINSASAKFICGEVTSTSQISPSWYEVNASLASKELYYSNCKISPSNNRYCCDIDEIEDKTEYEWKISDVFNLEITDIKSGYFAAPEKTSLTGEGYDVAPKLKLEKAIKVIYPNTALTISESLLNISLESSEHCSEFGEIKDLAKTKFQTNKISNIQSKFGENKISLYAICNNKEFLENYSFFIIKNMTLNKIISKDKIKSEETETINLNVKLSSPVSNIKLREYVPSDFKITQVSNYAAIQIASPFYNVIAWELSGDDFNLSYSIKAPKVSIGMHAYKFNTEIEDTKIKEEEVLVYKFLPIIIGGEASNQDYKSSSEKLSKSSSSEPVILENQKSGLTTALYSKTPKEKTSLELYEFNYTGRFNRSLEFIKSYKIKTNLNSTERGLTKFEYKTTLEDMTEKGYNDIQFFTKENKFIKIKLEKTESEGIIKYNLESIKPIDNIFIFGEKNSLSLIDKILNFFKRWGLYDY